MQTVLPNASSRFPRRIGAVFSMLLALAYPVRAADLATGEILSSADASDYSVVINGERLPAKTRFAHDRFGHTFVALATLTGWNLEPLKACTATLAGRAFCALDDFAFLHYVLNAQQREYAINVAPGALSKTSLDMDYDRSSGPVSTRRRAGFMNYDLHGVAGGTSATGSLNGFSSLLEGGFTLPGGTLITNFVGQTGDRSRSKFALLGTTWQHADIAHHTTLQIGDAISSGGTFGGELRYFGIGWSSDFSGDPGFITRPTLALKGISNVPSVVDLYVNNALTYSKDVPVGPFELNNLPTVNGAGQVQVVVRDLLGRQQVITGSYYGTPVILRQGLNDFAIETGFERSNYGLRNLQYGPFFAEANLRRGVSNRLTIELHAEGQATAQEAGAIGDYLLPRVGVFNFGIAANRGAFGHGRAALAGYDFQGKNWSAGTSIQMTSNGFWQLGNSANGYGAGRQANVHFGLSNERGDSIGLAYADQTDSIGGANKVLSVSIDREFRHGDLEVDALRTTSDFAGGLGVQVNYHVALGKRRSLDVESNHTPSFRDDKIDVTLSRPSNGVGYSSRVELDSGDTRSLSTQIIRYDPAGKASLTATAAGNAFAVETDLTGGVAYLDHRRFFTRRLFDAFAVVHVGYPHVRVYEDGELSGVTDGRGDLTIANLSANESTTLSIEPKDLPAGIVAVDDSQLIVPTFRAATSVRFQTHSADSARLQADVKPVADLSPTLPVRRATGREPQSAHTGAFSAIFITPLGSLLPTGTLLHAENLSATWWIRTNGTALLAAGAASPLRVTAKTSGQQCEYAVPLPTKSAPAPRLAPVNCVPLAVGGSPRGGS